MALTGGGGGGLAIHVNIHFQSEMLLLISYWFY